MGKTLNSKVKQVVLGLFCCLLPAFAFAQIGPPPVILVQPLSQIVLKNTSATFSVTALSGTTLTYKWRLNGAYIYRATNSTYTVSKALFNGVYSVEVINASGSVLSSDATLTVIKLPESQDDSYSIRHGRTLTVSPSGVMANDDNITILTAQAVLRSDVAHGTLILNPNGSFSYTPDPLFSGTDSFTYQVIDGIATGNVARVTINVTNRSPIAQADHAFTLENTSVIIDVLANDLDPDGDTLTAQILTSPAHGSLALNASGSLTYTPAKGYFGADSFTYNAVDPFGASSAATVTLTVYHPADLVFTSQVMTEQGFKLTLSGPAPATYVVFASSNLQDWSPIATNACATGLLDVVDPDSLTIPNRFYRAAARPDQ